MGKPRLPWKRGPAAWKVKCRAAEILQHIAAAPRPFVTLRAAARLFGLSTQPLRDWLASGYLQRTGPARRFTRDDLRHFVQWLAQSAQPFPPARYVERFRDRRGMLPYPYKKLATASIVWPKRRPALIPSELAALVPCHPSLLLHAIRTRALRARRRTRCRWEITRQAWTRAFPGTINP